MSSTHSSLITAFFKSPATRSGGMEVASLTVSNGDHCLHDVIGNGVAGEECEADSTGDLGRGEGGEGGEGEDGDFSDGGDSDSGEEGRSGEEGFAVNLCGLLTPTVLNRVKQKNSHLIKNVLITGTSPCPLAPTSCTVKTTEPASTVDIASSCEDVVSMPFHCLGMGSRQSTLLWDKSVGTLQLGPATPSQLTPSQLEPKGMEKEEVEEGEDMCAEEITKSGTKRNMFSRQFSRRNCKRFRTVEEEEEDNEEVILGEGPWCHRIVGSDGLKDERGKTKRRGRGRKRRRYFSRSGDKRLKKTENDKKEEKFIVNISRQLIITQPFIVCDEEEEKQVEEEEKEVVELVSAGSLSDVSSDLQTTQCGAVATIDSPAITANAVTIISDDCTPSDLDSSVIIVSASSPPPPTPSSLPSATRLKGSSLSSAWAHIFSRPVASKNTCLTRPTQPASVTSQDLTKDDHNVSKPRMKPLNSRRQAKPRSPRRHRSASHSPRHNSHSPHRHHPHSPLRRALSRSPKRSPCGVRQSVQRSPQMAPGSPLHSSLSARKHLIFPQSSSGGSTKPKSAPFEGLVHVRQVTSDPYWTLQPSKLTLPKITTCLKTAVPSKTTSYPPPALPPIRTHRSSTTPLHPVSHTQRKALLMALKEAHPHRHVSAIFRRYHRLRTCNKHRKTTPTNSSKMSSADVSRHDSLMCRVSIVKGKNGKVQVDKKAYRMNSHKKSLRLLRKRNSSQLGELAPQNLHQETRQREEESKVKEKEESKVKEEEETLVLREEKEENSNSAVATDLWSELYRPTQSNDIIGNRTKIHQLLTWLRRWKDKCSDTQKLSDQTNLFSQQRKLNHLTRKVDTRVKRFKHDSAHLPDWVYAEEEDEDDEFVSLQKRRRRRRPRRRIIDSSEEELEEEGGEEELCPVLLLCGGEGWGKTAAVYACSQELGFKVFEVNSSSTRGRANLLATLREATLSHQVSTGPRQTPGLGGLFQTVGGLGGKSGVSQPKKSVGIERRGGDGGLLSFFKPQASVKQTIDDKGRGGGRGVKVKVKVEEEGKLNTTNKVRGSEDDPATSSSSSVSLAPTTVILLEEVDILFDEDRGFWSAVYDVIETTRRPIILTCNDSRYNLDCDHIKITFDPPSLAELSLHIQLLYLSHDYHLPSEAAVKIAAALKCDIRHIFNSLQFWTTTPSPLTPPPSLKAPQAPSLGHITGLSESVLSVLGVERREEDEEEEDEEGKEEERVNQEENSGRQKPGGGGGGGGGGRSRKDLDIMSYCAEQWSYIDEISMETESHDCHMTCVVPPWWACPLEGSLLDELPVVECVRSEGEVGEGVRGEVEGRVEEVGRGVMGDPHSIVDWMQRRSRVREVHNTLEQCSEVFSLNCSRVGVACEGIPLLRHLCLLESIRHSTHTKRRFRHYLLSSPVDQTALTDLTLTARLTPPRHQ